MKNFYPIRQLFKISKKFGNIVAVEQSDKSYSYKDFWLMVSNLSKKILQRKKGPFVAVVGEKNILSYVSLFSVILSGGTYIPISSNLPLVRIFKIISLLRVDIIICPNKIKHVLKKKFLEKDFITEKDLSNDINSCNIFSNKVNKLAYIIFTSGSTGAPKGVCISRKSLEHYVKWLTSNLKIVKGSKCSQFPEIGFDLSVADIYGTLFSGGTLCPAYSIYSKTFPGRFIQSKRINYLVCVPSLIDIIKNSNDLNKKNLTSLKRVFFCGEPLLKSHVQGLFKAKSNLEIINSYGPTEATVSCTYKKVTKNNLKTNIHQSISIGKPIKGTKIKLMYDGDFSSKRGEIIIYGKQVADGYLNTKDNKKKFFFSKRDGASFKTGDYVTIINKEMYFKNRIDRQVKIKGHRIELDDITANILKFGIKNAATILLYDKIIAFYSDKKKINQNSIKLFLKKYIPEYMLPNYFLYIKKIPYNQNGKLDTNNLLKTAKRKLNVKK